jgi:hypothetical protein
MCLEAVTGGFQWTRLTLDEGLTKRVSALIETKYSQASYNAVR